METVHIYLFGDNITTVQSQYFVFLIPRQRGENTNEALNTKRHTLTTEKISSQCIRQDNTVQLHEIVPNSGTHMWVSAVSYCISYLNGVHKELLAVVPASDFVCRLTCDPIRIMSRPYRAQRSLQPVPRALPWAGMSRPFRPEGHATSPPT